MIELQTSHEHSQRAITCFPHIKAPTPKLLLPKDVPWDIPRYRHDLQDLQLHPQGFHVGCFPSELASVAYGRRRPTRNPINQATNQICSWYLLIAKGDTLLSSIIFNTISEIYHFLGVKILDPFLGVGVVDSFSSFASFAFASSWVAHPKQCHLNLSVGSAHCGGEGSTESTVLSWHQQ